MPHLGGIEAYTHRIARALVRRGCRVLVVSSNFAGLAARETIDGVEQIRLPVFRVARNRYPFLKPNKQLRSQLRDLRCEDIDRIIVNTRFHQTSLAGARLGSSLHVPVYLIEHGAGPLTLGNWFLDAGLSLAEHVTTRLVRGHVTAVYGVSQAACDHARKRFGLASAGVWPNCVEATNEEADAHQVDPPVIVYAGRLLPEKGADVVLAAARLVRPEYPGLQLRIAGDGPMGDALRRDTAGEPWVQLLGHIDPGEVARLDQLATVFVFTPRHPEGLPSGVLEAGVAGCPVVVSPMGGSLADVVIDGVSGLMVPPEPAAVAGALRMLLDHPQMRQKLGAGLRAVVTEKFSAEVVADKMLHDMGLAGGDE